LCLRIVGRLVGRLCVFAYLFFVGGDLILELSCTLTRRSQCVCFAIEPFIPVTANAAALVKEIAAQVQSTGKTIFDVADIVVDSCAPIIDASVDLKNHQDKVGPVSTMAFVTCVWMTVTTVAEILADRGVKLFIHPSHNVPGDTTAKERLESALAEYKRRVAGV
jgi:hypothetical protein